MVYVYTNKILHTHTHNLKKEGNPALVATWMDVEGVKWNKPIMKEQVAWFSTYITKIVKCIEAETIVVARVCGLRVLQKCSIGVKFQLY